MSIIKNVSAKNVELRLGGGGSRTLSPNKSVERGDVTNLKDLGERVKVTENLTEVMTAVDKSDLSEITIKRGSVING